MEGLDKYGIKREKTSFKITSDLKKTRDDGWNGTLKSGQIVRVLPPKKKGSSLLLQGVNQHNLPVLIGSVDFYDESVDYKLGVICWLVEKKLDYANGSTKSCLEFDQPIILVDSENIPDDILNSKTLRLRTDAKSKGCLGVFVLLLLGLCSIFGALLT